MSFDDLLNLLDTKSANHKMSRRYQPTNNKYDTSSKQFFRIEVGPDNLFIISLMLGLLHFCGQLLNDNLSPVFLGVFSSTKL